MMSLETLETQLVANWQDAEENLWNRALIYAEARQHFRSDPLFGAWLKGIRESYTGGGPGVEGEAKRIQMIWAATNLTQAQFSNIGIEACKSLKKKKAWVQDETAMRELIHYASEAKMSTRAIAEAVKNIEKGLPWREEEQPSTTPPPSSAAPEEGSYFSADTFTRELQRELISSNMGKACEFLGIVPSELSIETLTAARRRAAMRYHPDRMGGSNFEMDCVTRAADFIGATLGWQTAMLEINSIMGQ